MKAFATLFLLCIQCSIVLGCSYGCAGYSLLTHNTYFVEGEIIGYERVSVKRYLSDEIFSGIKLRVTKIYNAPSTVKEIYLFPTSLDAGCQTRGWGNDAIQKEYKIGTIISFLGPIFQTIKNNNTNIELSSCYRNFISMGKLKNLDAYQYEEQRKLISKYREIQLELSNKEYSINDEKRYLEHSKYDWMLEEYNSTKINSVPEGLSSLWIYGDQKRHFWD